MQSEMLGRLPLLSVRIQGPFLSLRLPEQGRQTKREQESEDLGEGTPNAHAMAYRAAAWGQH